MVFVNARLGITEHSFLSGYLVRLRGIRFMLQGYVTRSLLPLHSMLKSARNTGQLNLEIVNAALYIE